MATMLKPTRGQVTRMVIRDLLSPSMLVALAVPLTLPYWIFPLVYFLMRTLLVAPTGILLWLPIFALSAYILWAWGTWYVFIVGRTKTLRALRRDAIAGDEVAAKEHLALRLSGIPMWRFAAGFIALQVLIAPAVVLSLWHGMIDSPRIIKDQGQVRRATPREELILTLEAWQRRGIYGPLNNRD